MFGWPESVTGALQGQTDEDHQQLINRGRLTTSWQEDEEDEEDDEDEEEDEEDEEEEED